MNTKHSILGTAMEREFSAPVRAPLSIRKNLRLQQEWGGNGINFHPLPASEDILCNLRNVKLVLDGLVKL